jgi:hypothetical protein
MKIILIAFLFVVLTIGTYLSTEYAFTLLNQRSTVLNIIGILIISLTVTLDILIVRKIIRKK